MSDAAAGKDAGPEVGASGATRSTGAERTSGATGRERQGHGAHGRGPGGAREAPGARLTREAGVLAGRLARILGDLPSGQEEFARQQAFLESFHRSATGGAASAGSGDAAPDQEGPDGRGPSREPHPLDRLLEGLAASSLEAELLLLAGLPEEHEGLGSVLSGLHPSGESRPTVGLAVQLLAPSPEGRARVRRTVEAGRLVEAGALRVTGDAPFFARSLRLAPALWSALHGVDVWPDGVRADRSVPSLHGLEEWLDEPETVRTRLALDGPGPWTVLLTSPDPDQAEERGAALAHAAGKIPVRIALPPDSDPELERAAGVHALARGVLPVLRVQPGTGPAPRRREILPWFPGPIVVCAAPGTFVPGDRRPLLEIRPGPLPTGARSRMWEHVLPELGEAAPLLGSTYRLEPGAAAAVARDARGKAALARRDVRRTDVAASVRSRTNIAVPDGVDLRTPSAGWDDLVLPPDRLSQLREAVDRVRDQARVLDGWGFLRGRAGARGVRMLLTGPPGTGKSLSAEIVAAALDVDLLVADVSRMVSKWIGETEKNLARAFDAAEQAQAVLLFDEADALFARRTEVSDSNSRYANLETAFLLARLERFEGMTILSTNLRRNIDAAFVRRLEFVVDFREPEPRERRLIWNRHIPADAPLDAGVDLEELARFYPLTGGQIRNAAVAAAFQAAARDGSIDQRLLVHAIRREYEKAGHAFPGSPPGLTQPMEEACPHPTHC